MSADKLLVPVFKGHERTDQSTSNEAAALWEIPLSESLLTLKKVANTFCFDHFDIECPVCGQNLVEGERHECRLIVKPAPACECEAQGARQCGACEGLA